MAPTEPIHKEPSVWSPAGRIGRLRFLGILMVQWLLLALGGLLAVAIMINLPTKPIATNLPLILLAPGIYLGVVTATKRLHDVGLSGWWQLLAILPLINVVLGLWLLSREGDTKANKYGPPRRKWGSKNQSASEQRADTPHLSP